MKKLLLGLLSLVLYVTGSAVFAGGCLTDNGDGTLTDPNTGLIWQTCALGQTWDGKSCTGGTAQMPWGDAALAAEENRFQRKIDWILPTQTQNESLLKSYCKRWTRGGFWSSSTDGLEDAKSIDFFQGTAHSYLRSKRLGVRLVRSSQPPDVEIFKASLDEIGKASAAIEEARNEKRKERDAYDLAQNTNTVVAYTDYLAMFPNGINGSQAKEKIEKLRYESANRIATINGFIDFLDKHPNGNFATDARMKLEELRYEPVKRANTVVAYLDFLKKTHPNSNFVSDAKAQIKLLLEPAILKAEAAFKCEEARQLDKPTETAGISPLSSFDSCVDKRKFNNVLNLKNPQQQYLEAVKYENDNERSRAKRIYLTIMEKSSTSPMALKAADRLASMKDVEAVESASDASRAAAERAAEASRRAGEASREAAYSVNRRNADQCQKDRNACFSGCNVYKDYSQRNNCQSGCAMCAN